MLITVGLKGLMVCSPAAQGTLPTSDHNSPLQQHERTTDKYKFIRLD